MSIAEIKINLVKPVSRKAQGNENKSSFVDFAVFEKLAVKKKPEIQQRG